MFTEIDLSVEHVLMFVIIVFLLYHLIGGCSCIRDGFSVGGELCPLQNLECPSENYSAWVDISSSCTCPPGQNFAYHTDQNGKKLKRCDHNAGVLAICRASVNCSADKDHRMGQGRTGMAFDCANIKQDPDDPCDKWVDFHGFQCKNNPSSGKCTIDLNKPRCKPLKSSE